MIFVRIFDHGDLELSRQADDGRDRKDVHGNPAVAERVGRVDVDALCLGPGKDRLQSAPSVEDERPHGDQGAELDHRFECDGRNHAVMLLLGIDVACAEEDREQRHRRSDTKGKADIVHTGKAASSRRLGGRDGLDGRGDRLELKSDVGRNADHRDDRNENREAARFSEPR